MKRSLRSRLTYANVMATIAVFIALGGASYAAIKLPKNSVGTKQLKKNSVTAAKIRKKAVTTAKIADGAITGAKVDLGSLGTVPSAQTANTLPPHDPWHVVGTPGEPPFLFSWKQDPSASAPSVAFFKDHEGIVHFRGHATGSGGQIMFDLPVGYRPAPSKILDLAVYCSCGASSVGILNIVGPTAELPAEYQGALIPPGNTLSLDGLSFVAES